MGAGGRGGVSSGGKGRSSRAFWDRQGGCWGAHIHHRGRMRRFCWRGSWALGRRRDRKGSGANEGEGF